MNVSSIASVLINHLGVTGIGIGVFLNGLGIPGLSEVLLPLGGVGIRQGTIDPYMMFPVVLVCQVAGASVAYWIARAGGLPLVERYGKYVLISRTDLKSAEKLFSQYGGRMVAVGAFTPGIQGFVGYAAGLAKMRYNRFLVAVFFGKLIWIGALTYLGWVLGKHFGLIDRVLQQFGIVVLVLLIAAGVWYVRRHRMQKNAHIQELQEES